MSTVVTINPEIEKKALIIIIVKKLASIIYSLFKYDQAYNPY